MDEQFCDVGGGIRLCYDTFGDPADPALLLIMGLGTQMVAWHEDFCARLVGEGFHVIRFDNRDIGRSTHIDGAPTPTIAADAAAPAAARPTCSRTWPATRRACSTASASSAAHIVGASMGGMIAQTLAATPPGARALAHLDHVDDRRPPRRAAGAPRDADLPQAGAARARRVHRSHRAAVQDDRLDAASSATTTSCARSRAGCTTAASTRRGRRASSAAIIARATAPRRCGGSPRRRS